MWSLLFIMIFLLGLMAITGYILLYKEKNRMILINSLIEAKNRAEESDRFKMVFLANMSHEIRTPMNGVLGFLELLQEPGLTAGVRSEYFNYVNKSGERLLNTIDDIVELSKLESGSSEISTSVFNLNELAGFINEKVFFDHKHNKSDISFEYDGTPAKAMIHIDIHKLQSILVKLIRISVENANENKLTINAGKGEGNCLICIRFKGSVTSFDLLTSLFKEKAVTHEMFALQNEISGLRLLIVKSYVEMLNGFIDIKQDKNNNISVTLEIPCLQAHSITKEKLKTELENIRPDRSNIELHVVEDDDISYLYLEKLLQREGLNPTRSCNGREAVEYAKKAGNKAVILMDIKLPVMDGLTAIREIRKFNNEIPIIAQTAYAMNNEKQEALEIGCSDYITKPLRYKELMRIINKYCN